MKLFIETDLSSLYLFTLFSWQPATVFFSHNKSASATSQPIVFLSLSDCRLALPERRRGPSPTIALPSPTATSGGGLTHSPSSLPIRSGGLRQACWVLARRAGGVAPHLPGRLGGGAAVPCRQGAGDARRRSLGSLMHRDGCPLLCRQG